MPGAHTRTRRYHHYLKGLLWCSRCGRQLIIMRGKSKTGALYFYYICRGRQQKVCQLPYVRAYDIEQAVERHYETIRLSAALRRTLNDLFDQAVEQRRGAGSKERAQLRKRLTELDRQEDRYVELVIDPDWPRDKLTAKLRDIRDEKARLRHQLADDGSQVRQGRDNARRVLDYLQAPHQLYLQASPSARTKLNRLLFGKLHIDTVEGSPQVVQDEVHEPFATPIYLRRELDSFDARRPRTALGGVSCEPDLGHQVLDLLERRGACQALASSSSEAYSNYLVPPLTWENTSSARDDVTLVGQSAGLSTLLPATDHEPAALRRSMRGFEARSRPTLFRGSGARWHRSVRSWASHGTRWLGCWTRAGVRERRRDDQ